MNLHDLTKAEREDLAELCQKAAKRVRQSNTPWWEVLGVVRFRGVQLSDLAGLDEQRDVKILADEPQEYVERYIQNLKRKGITRIDPMTQPRMMVRAVVNEEAQERLRSLARWCANPEPREPSKPATKKNGSWIPAARQLLCEHPNMSNAEIARVLGDMSASTIRSNPKWRAIRESIEKRNRIDSAGRLDN
ncbi:HMG-box domain-containing protein [Roseiconus lacunae]|uniref:hypothetical protein n=1 Tax=Roseiconus lacunae TaxID=2605694 RepID=UPI001E50497A|nr:hypothetical protein [Roseiconus lacunae]MCD0459970.1 hypothetical protein [Roseiconus lacunae]